ncbi:site-2 protease family protein [Maribacter sp. ANRC-HE7]|uniref:Zinc metalloprotease n=1 Tax=Maribacter aquimaris TaxID=2737171 RepID=A0ABR7V0T0_9FLAO|nr:site-2 protease family protein [Maribacter aquimaris]MBD0778437.1 site-2 protease family protein [Maribacter aquimaris]
MKGSLQIGKVSGIRIMVHWTFLFILVWVVFLEMERGGTLETVLFNLAFILVVFFCVVLHELGHGLMAKRFGIKTKKITLLPIGGIASLEEVPENPKQELMVSLAGPFVNLLIAVVLYFAIPVQGFLELHIAELLEALSKLTLSNFLFYTFLANLSLLVFNLIPAFPMDGGRVLRALLAMRTDRVRATQIAANIGQAIAVVFLLLGMLFNPFLIIIALFIFLGAYGENKMVQQLTLLKGHTVKEAMLTQITLLRPDDTMEKVVDLILSGTERDFIVEEHNIPVGILTNADIIKNSKNRKEQVRTIMNTSFKTIKWDAQLKDVLRSVELKKAYFFPVLDNEGLLVGAIDMVNINEFILLQSKLDY